MSGLLTGGGRVASLAQLNFALQSPFRNVLINGDMSIAQRGTSTAGVTASGYHACDRWKLEMSTIGTWTVAQDTDVPTGSGFASSLKLTCTTADASPAAGDYLFISQKIEGQNLQHLKKGTASADDMALSFWVKSGTTGTYICELYDTDNTRHICEAVTISVADTWEEKRIHLPGDTTGTLANDTGGSLELNIWLAAGTTFTGGTLATAWAADTTANRAVGQTNLAAATSNYISLTGVQLEAGENASLPGQIGTDFAFFPRDENLRRCQRYYEKSYDYSVAPGSVSSAGAYTWVCGSANNFHNMSTVFSTRKRSTPTVVVYSPVTGASGKIRDVNGTVDINGFAQFQGDSGFNGIVNNVSKTNTALQYHYTADAEL